jgi:hypothetical protein
MTLLLLFRPHRYGGAAVKGYAAISDTLSGSSSTSDAAARGARSGNAPTGGSSVIDGATSGAGASSARTFGAIAGDA